MAKKWMPLMNNPARKETDSLLEELEKRINKEYGNAATEMMDKAAKYFERFDKRDADNLQKVRDGLMTQEEYNKWRVGSMLTGERYSEMVADLTNTALNADKAAMAIVNGSLPETFAINANYAAYEVERATGIDTSFTLYNKDSVARLIKDQPDLLPKPRVNIPEDKRWNKQHITSALTQGILQGDSMDNIAKRLQTVTDMDGRAAIRNARTMTTGAENAGKLNSYQRAKDMGIEGQNMWIATHDDRTRESHAAMDGETVDLGKKFSNGCEYPGDPAGDPSEVYNCRCSMVFVSKYSKFASDYAEQNAAVNIDGMSYDEWKNRHEKAPTITSYTDCNNLTELKDYMNKKYENLSFSDQLENLDFSGVKEAVGGIDAALEQYPWAAENLNLISVRNSGYMCSDGNNIYFNPTYFEKGKFNGNTDYAYLAGAHELGHIADMTLCLRRYEDAWDARIAWSGNEISAEIVRKAVSAVKKEHPQWKSWSSANIRRDISSYAASDTSETVAEAVGHYMNWKRTGRLDQAMKYPGGQLAKKIVDILEERMKGK